MNRKFVFFTLLLIILLLVTACEGIGNLKVTIYDSEQNLANDVYVGLYTKDLKHRINFAYTLHGVVAFDELPSGSYSMKIYSNGVEKIITVQIKANDTNSVKVNLAE
ncbi:hypothetical protein [Orenia marismortui]|uniref:DUF4382 domain-containing protein n=1 Tax=Orenia marismortui TaxID=46469 RepID=A0A4R8H0B8_9FIRM|nr:hypothetical protein [Orenia marismortui]TDX52742.1 hypothetical protein C7959_10596 [Orenia marismortui]